MTPAAKNSLKKANFVSKVQKRNGLVVSFDLGRITNAVRKAMLETGEGSLAEAELVSNKVFAELVRTAKKHKTFIPTVEGIQDEVETQLMLSDYVKTAKAYILYREKRAKVREEQGQIPENVRKLAAESKKYFRNDLGELVYYRSYSRWLPEEGRRETWIETVDRYMNFMRDNVGDKFTKREYDMMREAILKQEAMPSMRLLQFAGPAAKKTNVCAYNCSFVAPKTIRDFAEVMYVSMCGTGVGYTVESENIQQLPQIKPQTGKKLKTFVVPDSREGWCEALTLGMDTWYKGSDIEFDLSGLRPAGARLKTMGGKSSGPEPLRQLLDFTREKILAKQGRRLSNIDAHDILCKIGMCVVAGGVRRSAMISLSDLDDRDMRDAKQGQFYNTEPQRTMANNSAVYIEKPTNEDFLDEWIALAKSGTGERGIFNRGGLPIQMPERRVKFLKKKYKGQSLRNPLGPIGPNPCAEIYLQSKQFCNLSEVIARKEDKEKDLLRKVRIATMLGTYQASLTNFPFLSKEWEENCKEEALLGVSITGQWDCPAVRNASVLRKMKKETIRINQKYAKKLGVKESTAITCVKPSGTVSQVVDAASGTHPRHDKYYIRRIRISATDSLFHMLKDQGVPHHPEVGQSAENANTFVLEFPVKAPDDSTFKDDLSAIEQLEYWKLVKENFTEHNPSVTISVGEDEWITVANWLYENWDIIGGLSFLPRSNHVYQLAPYESISKEEYERRVKEMPSFDFSKIVSYEREDGTDVKKELACVAGVCEIDDVLAEEANKKVA